MGRTENRPETKPYMENNSVLGQVRSGLFLKEEKTNYLVIGSISKGIEPKNPRNRSS